MPQKYLLIIVAVLVMGLGMSGVAMADDHQNNSENSSENDSLPDGVNIIESGEESTDGDNSGENSSGNAETVYEAELNEDLRVVNTEWDENTAYIVLEADSPQDITLSDGSKAKAAEEGTFNIPTRSMTIPSGRTEVSMTATENSEVGAVVTIGHETGIQGFKHEVKSPNPFSKLITTRTAVGGLFAFLIGTITRVGYKVYQKQENGNPETLDGTEVSSERIGVKKDE
ncbi:hypothetical protein ACFR99_18825 [Haloarchaeobius amylolyticus]|uniref:Uncharacterized protein n=1 Tax=Haloarchaeobius amylolyticus TaxID=1198296 RepID=A0ABD6BN13_9EURY